MALRDRIDVLRRQIGESAWGDRVTRAREREATVQRVLALREKGHTVTTAARLAAPLTSGATVAAWVKRHQAGGLDALVDLKGRVATNTDDAVLERRSRPGAGAGRPAASFVKWAGGKAGVAHEILARLPASYGTYFEPMVGSGVVFIALGPARAVLGDANKELVNCWRVVRNSPGRLVQALGGHPNTRAHYLAVRTWRPEELPPLDRAARFIYLNKTGFNGLYRVNRDGHFNVPYGRIGHANIADADTIHRVSQKLRGVPVHCCDLAACVREAGAGDLVYIDPPYAAPRPTRAVRYGPDAFTLDDHRRVADIVRDLDRRGCHVIVSNADVPVVRDLYRGYLIEPIRVRRPIHPDPSRRDGWTELVIRNFGTALRRP